MLGRIIRKIQFFKFNILLLEVVVVEIILALVVRWRFWWWIVERNSKVAGNTPPVSPPQGNPGELTIYLKKWRIRWWWCNSCRLVHVESWAMVTGATSSINATPTARAGGGGGGD
jgi:hypothetical protein